MELRYDLHTHSVYKMHWLRYVDVSLKTANYAGINAKRKPNWVKIFTKRPFDSPVIVADIGYGGRRRHVVVHRRRRTRRLQIVAGQRVQTEESQTATIVV